MNPIERVRAAIHFENPDRVPVYKAGLGDILPMAMLPPKSWQPGHAEHERGLFPFHSDDMVIKLGLWRWRKPDWAKSPKYRRWLTLPREEVDEFGVVWNREGRNETLGHPGKPCLEDWSDYDTYLERYSPDADDKDRYATFVRVAKLAGRNRYRLCVLGQMGPFTIAHAIRGFTNLLIDHRRNSEELRRLLSHLTRFFVDAEHCWVKYGARPHGFIMFDDLGDQLRPFMSPELFADFYEAVYRPIIETAHELGCEMILHSCGKIDPLMPLFIEWGLDAFEFDSPRTIGYPDLEKFRGKISMWGCVDIQRFYSIGAPDECEREVWHMLRNMGTSHGGYCAYLYPQPHHIHAPKANIRAFRRGLNKYGVYSKIPQSWWDEPTPSIWKDSAVPALPSHKCM